MRKAISILLLGCVVALPTLAESRLVGAAGITQGTADSLYVKRDGSLDPDITGNLAVTVAGNPATFTNTTNAISSILFEFYMNRGTGASNDELQLDFYFDDDASAKVKAGSWIIEGDDLGAKGGSYASATWRSGSAAPADIIKIDGVNNAVIANFFSIDDQLFTGLTGSVDQMDFKIANGLAMQITPTQLRLLTTRNLAVDDSGHFQDRLNVGATLASLPASAMFGTASTTQGSIPWPPMTSAQRNAIGSPVEGLAVWDATNNSPNWYDSVEWRAAVSVKATSFTAGSIPFADGACSVIDDNSNLFWDDTDNQLGIGTNTPDDSAILDLSATDKGVLPPRMTTAQLGAISTPATGLFGFNATTGTPQYYNGSAWVDYTGPTTKAGAKTSGQFSGNPLTATVTFSTAFPDANYSVSIIGSDVRDWSVDSQAAGSFVINANAAQALSASVYWTATAHYDP